MAAKQGLPAAQLDLGWMYQNGWGLKQDRVEAIAWYLKASDQGYEPAKKHLQSLGVAVPALEK